MEELTPQLSQELQFKFLYHLWKLREELKRSSVNSSEVWKRMNVESDKDCLLPIILDILKEGGEIKEGENQDEVKLIFPKKTKPRLYMLDVLNNIINNSEESLVGVTLLIGGTIISGNLISSRKYYSILFKQMKQNMPENQHRELANAYNTIVDQLPKTDEENDVLSKIIGRDTVCLENPSIIMNGKEIKIGIDTVWAARLENVEAFTLGILKLES